MLFVWKLAKAPCRGVGKDKMCSEEESFLGGGRLWLCQEKRLNANCRWEEGGHKPSSCQGGGLGKGGVRGGYLGNTAFD